MSKHFQLLQQSKGWEILARKAQGSATEGVWLSLGGCPSRIVAQRIYRALNKRGGD